MTAPWFLMCCCISKKLDMLLYMQLYSGWALVIFLHLGSPDFDENFVHVLFQSVTNSSRLSCIGLSTQEVGRSHLGARSCGIPGKQSDQRQVSCYPPLSSLHAMQLVAIEGVHIQSAVGPASGVWKSACWCAACCACHS